VAQDPSMDDSIPKYQYSPIIADEEIRVLRLEPATSLTDPLVANLFVRKIRDEDNPETPCPDYHCVSYSWGTIHTPQYMSCDGRILTITTTVEEMLRHLRKRHMPRNLWVDFVCIDQANDAEKAKQVACMGQVYARATKAHAWLGPSGDEDQTSCIFALLRSWALVSDGIATRDSSLDQRTRDLSAPMALFLKRRWFSRRWVLQEVELARAVTVHCGDNRIPWNWICDGMARLHSIYDVRKIAPGLYQSPSTDALYALERAAALSRRKGGSSSILDLLWDHHLSRCSDERDRVFALYGLVSPDSRAKFNLTEGCPVNYSSHFTAVYTQLAATAVRAEHGSTMLAQALDFGALSEQDATWPSWVPSWNRSRKTRVATSLSKVRSSGLNDENTAVTVVKSPESTNLYLRGNLYRITAAQDINSNEHAIAYFKNSLEDSLPENEQAIYYELVASVVASSIEASGHFYDRTKFDLKKVFPHCDWPEASARAGSYEEAVLLLLKHELGVEYHNRAPPAYAQEALHREVDRMLVDWKLFNYECGGHNMPGIAFANVKSGDFVFRLWTSQHATSSNLSHYAPSMFGLIIRPIEICHDTGNDSGSNGGEGRGASKHPVLGSFRLIGGCVDSYPRIFWWGHNDLSKYVYVNIV